MTDRPSKLEDDSDEWDSFVEELLEDPETRAAYERAEPHYNLVSALIALRQAKGLSQRALAEMSAMSQPAMARIESGRSGPNFDTLTRIVDAAGAALVLQFEDEHGELQSVPISRGPVRRSTSADKRRRSGVASAV